MKSDREHREDRLKNNVAPKLIWSKLMVEEKNRAVGEAYGFEHADYPDFCYSLDACFTLAKEYELSVQLETYRGVFDAKVFNAGVTGRVPILISPKSVCDALCIALLRFKEVEVLP